MLRLLARGLSNREMAEQLSLSPGYRQAPHPAHLRQDRRLHPGRRDAVCHGARHPLTPRRATKWPERAMLAPPVGARYLLWPDQRRISTSTRGARHARGADNAATYRRWFDEGCSQGNVDLADELYSPDYVTHSIGQRTSAHPGGAEDCSSAPCAKGCRICGARSKRWLPRATGSPADSPCWARNRDAARYSGDRKAGRRGRDGDRPLRRRRASGSRIGPAGTSSACCSSLASCRRRPDPDEGSTNRDNQCKHIRHGSKQSPGTTGHRVQPRRGGRWGRDLRRGLCCLYAGSTRSCKDLWKFSLKGGGGNQISVAPPSSSRPMNSATVMMSSHSEQRPPRPTFLHMRLHWSQRLWPGKRSLHVGHS